MTALDSRRARVLLRRLAALADAAPRRATGARLGEMASGLVRPFMRVVRRVGGGLGADAPPEALHRLRVRIKRLRCAVETLAGLDSPLAGVVRRLVRMQKLLGRHQDAVTQAGWLSRHAEKVPLPAAAVLALGMVIADLERDAWRTRRRFVRRWKELARRVDRELLERPSGTPRPPLSLVRAGDR